MTDKAAYLQKMQAKLNEWEADINALQAKMSGASADTKIELNKQIDNLRAERSDMKQKLEELKNTSGEAWEDVRDGMEAAWDSASTSFKNAINRFK